jgi:cysteine-rich repeat protein
MKFDGETGDLLWRRDLDGGGISASDDHANTVAIDHLGDVVAGGHLEPATQWDMAVIKFGGRDGSDILCGDGVVTGFETCDDGNSAGGDGCAADCTCETPAACGNGITDGCEACDDGNLVDGDGCESNCALTPFNLRSGKKILVRDKLTDATKRKIVLVSKDPLITVPTAGHADDPREGGGLFRIVNPSTGELAEFPLPASGWKALGRNPEAKNGYKYFDKDLINGPCKVVIVKPGRVLRAVCKEDAIPFTLNELSQNGLTATLSLGSTAAANHSCVSFGGTILRDFGTGTTGTGLGIFKAKDGLAPLSCPLP